jgi:hypothetical protein
MDVAAGATLEELEQRLVETQREIARRHAVSEAEARAAARAPEPPAAEAAPARSWWDSIGARSLALAGGVITLLGIVLLYLFASRAGWIGDGMRVAFGAAVSTALVVAAPLVRRRYGGTHAADATLGVGLAGIYVTLLAATALYHMLPAAPALALAFATAAGGVLVAAWWGSETVAAFAVLGAIFVPGLAYGQMTDAGSLFAGLLYAAAVALMVMRGWWRLAYATAICIGVEVAVLLVHHPVTGLGIDAGAVIGVAAFAALTLAAGYGDARRSRSAHVPVQALVAIAAATAVAGVGAFAVLPGEVGGHSAAGLGLLVSGAALCTLMARCLASAKRRRRERDLASVLGAYGLVLVGIGTGEVLDGVLRVAAFALLAAGMAWLARRMQEERFTWAALVHLGAAAAFAFLLEAQPRLLLEPDAHALGGVASVAIVVVAALACLTGPRQRWTPVAFWTTIGAAVYGASLLALGLFEQGQTGPASLQAAFEHGQTAMSALWGLAGLGLLSIGLRRRQRAFRSAGLILFGSALAKLFLLDLRSLDSISRALSFLAVGVVLLVAGLVYQRMQDRFGLGV